MNWQTQHEALVRTWESYNRLFFEGALSTPLILIDELEDRISRLLKLLGTYHLTDKELVAVWNAAGKMGYPFGSLYQLLILTGQRRMEIATIQESWIDLEADIPVIEIPSASFKGGEWVQVVPLSGMAIEIIEKLPRFSGPFMLSTRGGETPISGFSKAKAKLNELSGVADWVVHDIRRTVRTNLSKLKVDRLVAELVIGHKQQGIHAVYDRYEYGPEKRHALEAWSARLQEIISGESATGNVVSLVSP